MWYGWLTHGARSTANNHEGKTAMTQQHVWVDRDTIPDIRTDQYVTCSECYTDMHWADGNNACPHMIMGRNRMYVILDDLNVIPNTSPYDYRAARYSSSVRYDMDNVPGVDNSCRDCWEPDVTTLYDVESRNDRHDTIKVCRPCLRRSYVKCADCETYVHQWDNVTVTASNHSFDICYECNNGRRGSNTYTDCNRCGDRTVEGNECCDQDESGGCTCGDCYVPGDRLIHDYSYKPAPVFKLASGEQVITRANRFGEDYDATLYFGMELEVEAPKRGAARATVDALGDVVYLKSDSSIGNGFEIVTHPMTFRYAMEEFSWDGVRQLRKDDVIGTSNQCGLHIHVSKNGFRSPNHEYMWIMFWHRNQGVLKVLAGRDSDYGSYDNSQREKLVDVVKKGQHSYRRSAINTQNEYTHEVRVFASTVYVNRIKAAIQLVEGTIQYTRHLAASKVMRDGGYSWVEFIVWLRSHGTKYAQLIKRIVDLNIDQEPRQIRAAGRVVWDESQGRYIETPGKILQEGVRA